MKEVRVAIKSEHIKLDSLLKYAGLCMTGGEAKSLIEEGYAFVNGQSCTMRGKKLRPGDTVTLNDTTVVLEKQ